jgi:hypothetical protein
MGSMVDKWGNVKRFWVDSGLEELVRVGRDGAFCLASIV